jgi:hypothetical protein
MSVRCIKSKPGTKDSFDVPNNTTEYKTVVFSRTKNVLKKDAKRLEEVTEYNYSKWLKQIIPGLYATTE